MAEVIRMPKMSDTMTEGVIAAWHKKVGDTVKSGDVLAEVETDKATMELESYEDGTLLYIGPKEKESVPVDGILAVIGQKGESYENLLNGNSDNGSKAEASKPAEPAKAEPVKEELKAKPAAPATPAANVKANVIRMPKMSDTMTEGTIVAWHKKVGDTVKSGDLLAEVETDKATMELESYEDGTLLYMGVQQGESVIVDGILAIVGEKDADYKALLQQPKPGEITDSDKEVEKIKQETTTAGPKVEGSNVAPNNNKAPGAPVSETKSTVPAGGNQSAAVVEENGAEDDRVKISPLAKRLAKERGIDIRQVKGSAENGRIVKKDIESFVPAAKPAPAQEKAPAKPAEKPVSIPAVVGEEKFEEVAVSQMRKTIARRLAESKFTAPHFYLTMEIDMDKAVEARQSMNEYSPVKISFNDMVLKAAAAALRKHPKINSSWRGDKIRYNQHIHIGVAVAIEEGLLVPVVRFADNKSLSQIAAEVKDLGGRAKNRQLQPSEWEGNTFTISNLGMFGIEEFTAIINSPEACILAVGGIKQTPVVKNGEIKIGNVMKVTLSCDHRVVDGATGAAFLQTLKGLLEDPVRILV
ncbi:pyruvate dehydrogenase complex dihydrolipoamide acetyltransferase [Rhodocytophaga rosea]|uniref:Acetyltransferase component of pyruvate dehydrogenase complex n=1 Tax=Rhodocytophaga rosea TaxID=2704465 RepID=A0A6C0GLR4_9BACT|nr:pyruvate dehydrogenase complex dihydrolipoamide acetyltransferase [Rhodocytophaga rosea]QHT68754.1 pyruvate dehydrogenase complex dihydrolipoamide acetyltransferase [Rhodocytophaga rosea]